MEYNLYEERVAILQFCEGLTEYQAKKIALEECLQILYIAE